MLVTAMSAMVGLVSVASGADATWPKEITFALLSTENAAEITRRWTPILAQLEKDLGIKVRSTAATDYRGTIEALKFKKAEMAHLGPKSYVEASTGNYANVEPIAQLQLANGSLGYRSCLNVHAESDIFSPEAARSRDVRREVRPGLGGVLPPRSLADPAGNLLTRAARQARPGAVQKMHAPSWNLRRANLGQSRDMARDDLHAV